MTQIPSLGRIVIASADPAQNNGSGTAPAMIVRVWPNGLVNLQVMLDGAAGVAWVTSATLYGTPEEFAAAREDRDRITPSLAGAPFAAAYWPPRN